MNTFTSIKRKETLLTQTVLAATCIGLLPTIVHAQQKPNILIIYTDDMGIGDLSCYNNGWSKTPNIDKLAAQGIKFNNYYSAAPVSSPSRVGLTTGMFPLQMGINTYLQSRNGNAACEQYGFDEYVSTWESPDPDPLITDSDWIWSKNHWSKIAIWF